MQSPPAPAPCRLAGNQLERPRAAAFSATTVFSRAALLGSRASSDSRASSGSVDLLSSALSTRLARSARGCALFARLASVSLLAIGMLAGCGIENEEGLGSGTGGNLDAGPASGATAAGGSATGGNTNGSGAMQGSGAANSGGANQGTGAAGNPTGLCHSEACPGACSGSTCTSNWSCQPDAICLTIEQQYCGCDGITFSASSCAPKAYAHEGPCEEEQTGALKNCNYADVPTRQAPPPCPTGYLRQVIDGQYASCIALTSCACNVSEDCGEGLHYACYNDGHCGDLL